MAPPNTPSRSLHERSAPFEVPFGAGRSAESRPSKSTAAGSRQTFQFDPHGVKRMSPDGAGADGPPVRVGHYGGASADGLAADARCAPRRVDGAIVGSDADLDCLLVDWDGHDAPADAVAEGAAAGVPVVAFDPAGRAARAARATRAGVTEYVTPAALDDETVADRVVAAAADDGRAARDADDRRFVRMFDGLPDAVVDAEFVDDEPVVRSVNDAFGEVFGYDAEEVRGESINDLLVPPERAEEARRIDRQAVAAGHNIEEVERRTTRGRRTFLFRWLRYPTPDDGARGFAVYIDITARKRRKRRLQVLQRVLRHNIRNEITAMRGHVDRLAETTDGETARHAELLRDHVESIAALGEQARDIEEAIDEDGRTRSPVDPATVAERVCRRHDRETSEATIRFTAPENPPSALADGFLERAVDAVVENALEHHDGTPTVEIAVEPVDDRWVDIVVADDGPGIPERERRVVGGETAVTQLDHGTGLGLWVARWVLESVDGRLLFGDADDGAVVRLRLRRTEASA